MSSTEGSKMQIGLIVLIMCLVAMVFVIWEGVQTRQVKESQDKATMNSAMAEIEEQKVAMANAVKELNDAVTEMRAAQLRVQTPTATPVPQFKLPERIIVEIHRPVATRIAPTNLPLGLKIDKKKLKK